MLPGPIQGCLVKVCVCVKEALCVCVCVCVCVCCLFPPKDPHACSLVQSEEALCVCVLQSEAR